MDQRQSTPKILVHGAMLGMRKTTQSAKEKANLGARPSGATLTHAIARTSEFSQKPPTTFQAPSTKVSQFTSLMQHAMLWTATQRRRATEEDSKKSRRHVLLKSILPNGDTRIAVVSVLGHSLET